MYIKIKQFIKTFIPKSTLHKYEPMFRFVFYQFYKGVKFQCNVCSKDLRKFILLEDGDRLCPYCGSISRVRRLKNILDAGLLKEGLSILDFSPSRSLYRVLKNTPNINYISTDLSGDFLADFQYDITAIHAENDKYDIIICYHVLEHIENDKQAMRELFRVLKKGGTCLIQTPFKLGDIYEDSSIESDKERYKHFGQKDHVRIYSLNGLKDRLVSCGFLVTIKQFAEPNGNKFGFNAKEDVLICTKQYF